MEGGGLKYALARPTMDDDSAEQRFVSGAARAEP